MYKTLNFIILILAISIKIYHSFGIRIWSLLVTFAYTYIYKYKRGDPIVCPYWKKTYYLENTLWCEYDFNPFYDHVRKSLKKNIHIDHYKWTFYYDPYKKLFYEAKLSAIYKIGMVKPELHFTTQTRFIDNTGTVHSCDDQINARILENFLTVRYYYFYNLVSQDDDLSIKKIYNNDNELIGYNINTGTVWHEIIIKPKPKK